MKGWACFLHSHIVASTQNFPFFGHETGSDRDSTFSQGCVGFLQRRHKASVFVSHILDFLKLIGLRSHQRRLEFSAHPT